MVCDRCTAKVIDKKTKKPRQCRKFIACDKKCNKYCSFHIKNYTSKNNPCPSHEQLYIPKTAKKIVNPKSPIIYKIEDKSIIKLGSPIKNNHIDLPDNIVTTKEAKKFLESKGYEYYSTPEMDSYFRSVTGFPIYVYKEKNDQKGDYKLVAEGIYDPFILSEHRIILAKREYPKRDHKFIQFEAWKQQYISDLIYEKFPEERLYVLPFRIGNTNPNRTDLIVYDYFEI